MNKSYWSLVVITFVIFFVSRSYMYYNITNSQLTPIEHTNDLNLSTSIASNSIAIVLGPADVAGMYVSAGYGVIDILVSDLGNGYLQIQGRTHIGAYNPINPEVGVSHKEVLNANVKLENNRALYTEDGEVSGEHTCTYNFLFEPNKLTVSQPKECEATIASSAVQKNYDGTTSGGVYIKSPLVLRGDSESDSKKCLQQKSTEKRLSCIQSAAIANNDPTMCNIFHPDMATGCREYFMSHR